MFREEKPRNHKDPIGRFVLLRAFEGGVLRRHAEWDASKYMILAAKALIANAKRSKVAHVQVLDSMHGNALVFEARA